jgi:hypothetical protein
MTKKPKRPPAPAVDFDTNKREYPSDEQIRDALAGKLTVRVDGETVVRGPVSEAARAAFDAAAANGFLEDCDDRKVMAAYALRQCRAGRPCLILAPDDEGGKALVIAAVPRATFSSMALRTIVDIGIEFTPFINLTPISCGLAQLDPDDAVTVVELLKGWLAHPAMMESLDDCDCGQDHDDDNDVPF